jgi:hypothetical protein
MSAWFYAREFPRKGAKPIKQSLYVCDDKVFGAVKNLIVVTLAGDGEVRSMTWILGLPWWVEWRSIRSDGSFPLERFMRARLVAFGKKGEKGTIVPPIESGLPMRPADEAPAPPLGTKGAAEKK